MSFKDKNVLVIGLCDRTRAACGFLQAQGARVMAVDGGDNRLRQTHHPFVQVNESPEKLRHSLAVIRKDFQHVKAT